MCINHPDRKVRSRGLCGACYNKYLLNRDPEKKKTILQRKRELWAIRYSSYNGPEHAKVQKNRHLKHRYGIDLEEYEKMHVDQNNRCAICGDVGGNTRASRLYVDHDHSSGRVRQLLCPKCNTAVGVIEQGIGRIKELANYLHKHAPTNKVWDTLRTIQTPTHIQD